MEFGQRINLHTHIGRCRHARGSVDEYCREAIRQGIRTLGISDHGPFPDGRYPDSRMDFSELETYCQEIRQAQLKFPELEIFAGLEVDYMASVPRSFYEDTYLGRFRFDYLIVGTHFIEPEEELSTLTPAKVLRRYMESTVRSIESGLFRFVAHPDIITRATQRWTPEIERMYTELIDASKAHDIPLEINAYGMRKPPFQALDGARPQYPWRPFWELAAARGVRAVVNSDAHTPEDVWGNTDQAIAFGAAFGLRPVNGEVASIIRMHKQFR